MNRGMDRISVPLKHWLKELCLSFLAGILLSGFCLGLGASFISTDPIVLLRSGLYFTLVTWIAAIFAAWRITQSADAFLWPFTPLTPKRYFTKNLRRNALFILTIYLVAPAAILGMTFALTAAKEEYAALRSWHFLLNAALFYYLAMATTLSEAMTGKRGLTYAVFMPRHLVRQSPVLFMFCPVLYFASKWCWPLLEPTLRKAVNALMQTGILGDIAILLLSPMSTIARAAHTASDFQLSWEITAAIPETGQPANGPLLSWGITLFLTLLLAFAIRKTIRAWTASAAALEAVQVEHWKESKETVAETEEEIEEDIDEGFAALFATPEIDEAPDAAAPLPYNETLPTEIQTLRHEAYWRQPPPKPDDSAKMRFFGFLFSHIWFAVVLLAWALSGFGTSVMRSHLLLPLGFSVCATFALAAGANKLRSLINTGVSLPLRWPALIRADYLNDLRKNAVADILAALLFVSLFNLNNGSALLLFAYLQIMRITWRLSIWLWSLKNATGKTASHIYNIVFIVAFTTKFIAILIRILEFANGNNAGPLPAVPICLLACAITLFITASLLLAFSLRKSGADILGGHKSLANFIHEPL